MQLLAFLSRLENVRQNGRGYTARCPAHDDRRNSLSVGSNGDGKILLHCHAGCKPQDIVAALGLRMSDLFANGNGRRIVATYDYRDASGKLLFQVVRYQPKDFRQRRPDGKGGWVWRLGNTPRVLYRLPELLAADPSAWIFVCEGEKDADSLARQGLTATTNAGGAGKWQAEYSDVLRGRRVCILPDNDEPGRRHAQEVARSLSGVAAEVRVVELPNLPAKGDVSDWLAAGGTKQDLLRLVEAAPVWKPEAETEAAPAVKVMQRFHARPFSQALLSRYKFLSTGRSSRSDFYRFDANSGLWRDDAEAFIDHWLRQEATLPDELKKTHVIDEIVADVRGLCWRPEGLPEPPPYLIPFANGVFDLRSSCLRAFEASDSFTWRLPWRFNPEAQSEFLVEKIANFTDEIQRHFYELLGYCLWRGYPYQKFFLWYGRGTNGKGFLSTTLTYALGVENVAGVSLSDIQTQRFAAANLYHKLANVSGEVRYEDLTNTDLLKKATGGDFLEADRKFRDPLRFKNYAKLLFLTNDVPRTRDTTDAFYRRAFVVHFEHQFEVNPRIMNELELLPQDAAGAAEFEWLLSVAVETLQELRSRNFVMTGDLSIAGARQRYEQLSNPLRQFLSETCEVTYRSEDFIFKFEFFERFGDWLRERGLNAYSDKRLSADMRAMGYEDSQRGEKRWLAWVGLRWRA